MMSKEELDALLARAIIEGQARVATLCASQVLAVGDPLFCRVCWPKSHKDEPFLLVGPEPAIVVEVVALNEAAGRRVVHCGDTFASWWALQAVHEQFAFTLQMQVVIHKYAQPSGLVLAH